MAMTHRRGNRLFLNEKGGHGAEEGRALRKGGGKGRDVCPGGGRAIAGSGAGRGAEHQPPRGPAAWPHQCGETGVSWEKISKEGLTLQVCKAE